MSEEVAVVAVEEEAEEVVTVLEEAVVAVEGVVVILAAAIDMIVMVDVAEDGDVEEIEEETDHHAMNHMVDEIDLQYAETPTEMRSLIMSVSRAIPMLATPHHQSETPMLATHHQRGTHTPEHPTHTPEHPPVTRMRPANPLPEILMLAQLLNTTAVTPTGGLLKLPVTHTTDGKLGTQASEILSYTKIST